MKKYVLVVLAVLGLVASVNADLYLAGSFNGWNAAGNIMTDNLDGTFSASLAGISTGRHEFKVTNGTWDWNVPGNNSWLYTDAAGNITVTVNTNVVSDGWMPEQYRIGLNVDPGSWTVAGNFQGWNNAAGNMTALGGGLHSFSQALSAGEYEFKAVVTGTWDSIGQYERSGNTGNFYVNLASDAILNVYVDNLAGTVKYEVVPEPATLSLLGLGALAMFRRKK